MFTLSFLRFFSTVTLLRHAPWWDKFCFYSLGSSIVEQDEDALSFAEFVALLKG